MGCHVTHFVKYQKNKLRTSKSYVHFLETACRRGRRGTFLYAYTHYDLCGTGFVGGYQNFATFSMSVCMSVCVKVVGRYKTFDGVPDKKYCVYCITQNCVVCAPLFAFLHHIHRASVDGVGSSSVTWKDFFGSAENLSETLFQTRPRSVVVLALLVVKCIKEDMNKYTFCVRGSRTGELYYVFSPLAHRFRFRLRL